MEIFLWYNLKDIIDKFMEFPINIRIEHFPSQDDFVEELGGESFYDYVIPIHETIKPYNDDLLHIHFNENGEIDNEPYIVEYVKKKNIDDMYWFTPLTIQYVNEAIEKVVDLFNWYCKELINQRISEFSHDLRRNEEYTLALCEHYGVYDIVDDLFFRGYLPYFKYVKHPDDIDTFYAKLDKFKTFVSKYKKYRKKHPMYIKGVCKVIL